MRTPLIRVALPDGRVAAIPAGGLLGRLPTAALRFEDPRVSEAHALVSLRGGRLWVLALRGSVEVDGSLRGEFQLAVGQRIRIAEDLVLTVEAVELPDRMLVLSLPDGSSFPLTGEVVCLVEGAPIRATPRFVDPALARFWPVGPGWRGLVVGQRARDLADGIELIVGGHLVRIAAIDPASLSAPATERRGQLHPPLRLVLTFSEVTVMRPQRPPARLSGFGARILGELAEYSEPVPWQLVAGAIWPNEDLGRQRQNWDKALGRLRQQLTNLGVRDDLVRTDGRGNVGLHLLDGDEADRSGLR